MKTATYEVFTYAKKALRDIPEKEPILTCDSGVSCVMRMEKTTCLISQRVNRVINRRSVMFSPRSLLRAPPCGISVRNQPSSGGCVPWGHRNSD